MFFKKKKPDPSSEVEHQAIAPGLSSSEKSMFAPGLNPQPTQIDFGLGGSGQNPQQQPYSDTVPVGSYDPWASSAETGDWKPPTGTEDWMSTNYSAVEGIPTTGSGEVSPVESNWQPPLEYEPSLAPLSGVQQSTTELTPEQSWSMMEPSMPQAQPMIDYSSMDFTGDFASGLGVEPPGLGTASANPQDDWMKEFEEPNAQFPELSSAPVSQSTDFASSTPLNPLEESWSPAVPPELGYSPENAGIAGSENLLPPISTDFQSQLSSDWSMSPNPLPSQNLAPTDWSDGFNSANTEPAYTGGLPLPEAGFPAVEDTQFLGPNVASASSSLDTLWDASFSETGTDLQSQFGPADPVQPTWNITEPNLGTSDLSPDLAPLAFSEPAPSHLPLSQTDETFDPLGTSHALEAGWSQYEGISSSLDEPEAWQTTALPNLTSNASWVDEQVPAGAEWVPQAVGNAPEPVYFHELPAEPESETQLWDNLNSLDFAPGEQVPYASGAMMDSINEQLYPEDPFTAQGEFAAGGQIEKQLPHLDGGADG